MKLWIDNEKDPALAPQFGLDPAGWIVARSVSEAVALIRSTAPDEIALDWDLGWGTTGEDVILEVANLYGPGRRPAPKVTFISAMDESNALLLENLARGHGSRGDAVATSLDEAAQRIAVVR